MRQPPLESSNNDGFVGVSPLVVPAADWEICTRSNHESDFAQAGSSEIDLGISKVLNSLSDDIVVC